MKAVQESQTIYTELMVPTYANFGGKVHGGLLLSLMDKVAYVCAAKHSSAYCVTVAVEGVEFLNPVEVGDLLTIKASINYVGVSSMIVGMRVEAFNPRTGVNKHTNSSYFIMAAKDDNGHLIEVPGLILESNEELRRFCEGKYLKSMSVQRREMMKGNLQQYSADDLRNLCKGERCELSLKTV